MSREIAAFLFAGFRSTVLSTSFVPSYDLFKVRGYPMLDSDMFNLGNELYPERNL